MSSPQHHHRLLRSVLYLPANNVKMVEKATSKLRNCDAFIFDMEDAVPQHAKQEAREGAKLAIRQMQMFGNAQQTCVVRVNGVNTPHFEQDCLAAMGADCVLLPKAERVEDLRLVRSLVGSKPDLWCMLETPLGVLNAAELAKECQVLVMGTVDLANELGCSVDPELKRKPLETALMHSVLVAKAHGVQILDGVYIHLKDHQGFVQECLQGMQFGFHGKTLIHPNTIDQCNQMFSPSTEQLANAQAICDLYLAAGGNGGAIEINGRLVEELHIRRALQMINFDNKIKQRNQ
ncbi:hypothetical protein BASA81_002747 [Batrachochytrium salamandrivorans]|nr:hypothetical protein BASA81_002747 [Batrachochytrium salamandrivorans]